MQDHLLGSGPSACRAPARLPAAGSQRRRHTSGLGPCRLQPAVELPAECAQLDKVCSCFIARAATVLTCEHACITCQQNDSATRVRSLRGNRMLRRLRRRLQWADLEGKCMAKLIVSGSRVLDFNYGAKWCVA